MTDNGNVLDLFCCAGGAAKGYADAGYSVYGVDIEPRPNYPFRFVQADALQFLVDNSEWVLRNVVLIHASPPCQAKATLTVGTNASKGWGAEHADLVGPTRALLQEIGLPYVIEQPNGKAEIRKDVSLCGEMFHLGVQRHRNFELGGWSTEKPKHVKHRGKVRGWNHGEYHDGPYVQAYGSGGGKATVEEMQVAMGIDWTDVREELTEAIPPAYTNWLGEAFTQWRARNG